MARFATSPKGPCLVGAALLGALVAIGCGSGAGDQLSKAEFIERAAAVCTSTSRRIESEFAAYAKSKAGREAARAEKAGELSFNVAAARVAERILIPAMRQQLAKLRALGVPGEADGRTKVLLGAFNEGVEKAEARPERAARDGTEAFGKAGRLADAYGIENC